MRAEELGSLEKTIRLKKTPLNKVLEKYWPKRSAEVRKANLKQLLSKAYGDDILIDLYYRRWCAGVDPLDCEEIAKLYGKHWKHSTKGKRKGKEIDQHKQSKKVEVF